jgi:hypothetical protein
MKRKFVLLVFLAAVLVMALFMFSAVSTEIDQWITKQDMPNPKADGSAAVYNGKLYVFGGYNQGAGDARCETYCYDPAANAWTQKASMPTARWGLIAVELNDKIFVFGGTSNVNEVYDPASDSWMVKNKMPSGFNQGLMAVQYNGKIHLFYRALHYEYDPSIDIYTAKAPMLTPRTWATVGVVGSKIYIIGGFYYDAVNTNEVYDPATDTWATKTAMPVRKYGGTRENPVINDIIYVTHGLGYIGTWNWGFQTTNYAYDPATDSWQQKASGIHARDGVQCGVINNKLYVVGGRADFKGPYGTSYCEEYSVSSEPEPSPSPTPTPTPSPTPPPPQAVKLTVTYEPFGFVMSYELPNGQFTAPSKISMWQHEWTFKSWSDGNTELTRTFTVDGVCTLIYQ